MLDASQNCAEDPNARATTTAATVPIVDLYNVLLQVNSTIPIRKKSSQKWRTKPSLAFN